MIFNKNRFSSPKGSPGHRMRISVIGGWFPHFTVSFGATKLSFNGKGSPEFLTHRGVFPSLFDPTPELRDLFWLAVAVIEAQEQFQKDDYPDIYGERMEDLTQRDRAVIQALSSWKSLSELESESLLPSVLEELRKSRARWKSIREDLVGYSLSTVGNSSAAGQIKALLSPNQDTEIVRLELDEAYEEYKRIYCKAYEETPALASGSAGHP